MTGGGRSYKPLAGLVTSTRGPQDPPESALFLATNATRNANQAGAQKQHRTRFRSRSHREVIGVAIAATIGIAIVREAGWDVHEQAVVAVRQVQVREVVAVAGRSRKAARSC